MIAPIEELQLRLAKLPGFGRRSAARAALALVRERARLMEPLQAALAAAHDTVACCSRCGAFTTADADPCRTCTDPSRDGSVVCVVEEPADIVSMESSGAFRGRYHSLGGKLSPARRMGPEKLRLAELADRVVREGFAEVLLALSTDMEGDATAGYVAEYLKGTGVKITRLAFGLPADSGIAYSDPLTLKRAIVNRTVQ
ncbi:MAG: recombination mediator RecR [Kiritimatiellae bacterium]|nr:recombination mediator RecR [Kiritimatiellia bacterium]